VVSPTFRGGTLICCGCEDRCEEEIYSYSRNTYVDAVAPLRRRVNPRVLTRYIYIYIYITRGQPPRGRGNDRCEEEIYSYRCESARNAATVSPRRFPPQAPRGYSRKIPLGSQSHSRISSLCVCARPHYI